MKSRKLKFNSGNVLSLRPRVGRQRDTFYNEGFPGLVVLAFKSKNSFASRMTVEGRSVTTTIGDCSLLSVEEAYEVVVQRKRDLLLYGDAFFTQKKLEAERRKEVKFGKFVREEFFPHLRLSNRSFKVAEGEVRNHLLVHWGSKRLSELEGRDLERIMVRLQDAGYRPSTINNVRDKARQIGFYAIKLGYLDVNPFRDVKKLAAPKRQLSHLADASIPARLMAAARKDKNPAIGHFVAIAALTGLRKSSILGLKWEMVDFERRILTLEQAKSGKTNHSYLSDAALEELRSVPRVAGCDYVLVNPQTGTRYVTVDNAFRRVVRAAGLEGLGVTPHALRHIYSSLYVVNGGSLYVLQKLLNHSSYADVTERYAHLRDDTLEAANDSISELIMGALEEKSAPPYLGK